MKRAVLARVIRLSKGGRWARRLVIACCFVTLIAIKNVHAQNDQIEALYNRGVDLQVAGRRQEAIQHYEAALAILLKQPGHRATERLLSNLADMYNVVGREPEAVRLYDVLLDIQRKLHGDTHADTRRTMRSMGLALLDAGDYPRAISVHRDWHQAEAAVHGPDSIEAARALRFVASAVSLQDGRRQALPIFQESLRIARAKLGDSHPELREFVAMLGAVCSDEGRYEEAEEYLLWARRISLAHPNTANAYAAASSAQLGTLYRLTGRAELAEPFYLEAIRLMEAEPNRQAYLGPIAEMINNLAFLYYELDLDDKALAAAQQAVALLEPVRDREAYFYASALSTLGLVYTRLERDQEAEDAYVKAISLNEGLPAAALADTTSTLVNLANLYAHQQRFEEAERLFDRALDIQRTFQLEGGADHALTVDSLAWLEFSKGAYVAARERADQAIRLYRELHGVDGVRAARLLGLISRVELADGKLDDAMQSMDRRQRLVRDYTTRVLPTLAENDQLAFWTGTGARSVNDALSLTWHAQRSGHAAVAEYAALWLLNGKGTINESLAQQTLVIRDARDPRTALIAKRLLRVRAEIARLSQLKRTDEQVMRAISEQTALADELASSLGRHESVRTQPKSWLDLDNVRRSIPMDAVFIDLIKVLVLPTDPREQPAVEDFHYLAVVVPPQADHDIQRDIQLVDLGPADPIDGMIRSTLHAARDAGASGDRSTADAHEAFLQVARKLAAQILVPLDAHLASSQHVILCPDAELWLVPWAAMPMADGRFLIEQAKLSVVHSARDLLEFQNATVSGNAAVIVADPDFDLDPATAREMSAKLADIAPASQQSRRALGDVPHAWEPLAGTARELEWILPSVTRLTGVDPQVLTRSEALEGAAKATWRPRLAIYSTHGFFRGASTLTLSGDAAIARRRTFINPMLNCGLVFAGANRPSEMRSDEDGILTGMEVLGMDLEGTELVVLSACETGLGDTNIGNGVAGLRQAFQLAGAHAVLSTLWQVPDQATAVLIDQFFLRLTQGNDKAQALADAQRTLIQRMRDEGLSPHPYFWGAFSLAGNWQTPAEVTTQSRATPAKFIAIVAADRVSLRKGKESIRQVPRGQRLVIHQVQDDWYWASLPGESPIGWIQASQVRVTEEAVDSTP